MKSPQPPLLERCDPPTTSSPATFPPHANFYSTSIKGSWGQMEIELLLELLEGKETHSKRSFFIIIILNIQMNDPINWKPLCSVNPSQESHCALAALPCRKQSPASSMVCHPPGLSPRCSAVPPRPWCAEGSAPDAGEASPWKSTQCRGNLVSLLGELRREWVLIALMRLLFKKTNKHVYGEGRNKCVTREVSPQPMHNTVSPCSIWVLLCLILVLHNVINWWIFSVCDYRWTEFKYVPTLKTLTRDPQLNFSDQYSD